MSKIITLDGLRDYLTNLKRLFVTKTDAESTYETKANAANIYETIDTKLTSKANTSDLSTVAASGDYNDLINKPNLPQLDDNGSLHVTRDTDGHFFLFTHNDWSTSPVDAWGGMYFQTSDGRDVFGFAARQTSFPIEKFSIGNNGYLRGYDTNGKRSVTLVINGGMAGQPDTQNITVDGTFVNAGNQQPYSANMYTIGTSDMPYKAMYAETFKGNASTATKLKTARTIALSGAATGTATSFDGSGNITIPVTALASSAIRAQWYAAYPDGPEAHNAMWGGRDITAAFDAGTVSANIANGTFRDIFPGDYITKQVTISGKTYTVNWVVADCDYWWHKGDQNNSMETHHVVIVPQEPIFNADMNNGGGTIGGYAGSRMYRNVIPACATGIVNAFGSSHILTFRDGITNSVDTSHVSSGIPQYMGTPGWWGTWVSVQCNLMSEKMVYGAPICSAGAMDNTMATRQMSAFRLSERLINYNCQWWWLRDVTSSGYFALVHRTGNASASDASSSSPGVRPFALLR